MKNTMLIIAVVMSVVSLATGNLTALFCAIIATLGAISQEAK